ncbi:hypothetical protein BV20DRAFT_966096 [Pilatotrama ljubarskyi]|nr:hypothetical protein BV20DRAFT_966096 [Pilatotrama ljubarskyi]
MTEPRPNKRTRTEEHEASNPPPTIAALTRDEECWYEDGNLTLVARDVEFRVYMGPLVKHSPVFKDMLSLPQPAEYTGEAFPRVHVTDSPEDLRHFLRCFALGNELYLNVKPSNCSTAFSKVSAIVRLCHKYDVEGLLKKAIHWLKARYPTKYSDWSYENSRLDRELTPPQSIGVVNLARLVNIPSLLVSAFLDCCSLTPQELEEGLRKEDGQRETLSEEDHRRVLNARSELVKADAQAAIHIFQPVTSDYCASEAKCAEILEQVLQTVASPLDPGQARFRYDMVQTWWERTEDDWLSLCELCLDDMDRREKEIRRALWDRLPTIFGL